jgi:Na+/H+-dicarboxylate symporter
VTLVLIDGVLKVAPVGVAALLFGLTSRLGFDVLRQLAAYVGVVLLGLALHMFVVYSLSVRFFGGRNRLLDMCRTTLNVVGDLAAAVYVARGEPVEEPGAAAST